MVTKESGQTNIYRDSINCPDHCEHGEWEGHFWEAPGYRGDIETTAIESSKPGIDSSVSDFGVEQPGNLSVSRAEGLEMVPSD